MTEILANQLGAVSRHQGAEAIHHFVGTLRLDLLVIVSKSQHVEIFATVSARFHLTFKYQSIQNVMIHYLEKKLRPYSL